MKKVVIEPGCITCGACEFVAPQIFEVTDVSHIKENVTQKCVQQNVDVIKEAIQVCPVSVIKYEE